MTDVRFHRPHLTGREEAAVAAAFASGHLRGDGPFAARASELLARRTGSAAVLLTPSATHALELAALLLDVGPGDEVIMPSFTFVSTANAIALRGATPVFVDIAHDTLGLRVDLVEAAVTPKTRAVVVVHYDSAACDMDELVEMCARRGLRIIEDDALGFGGTWAERALGSFGSLGALSFHETKSIQCGEGGALLVNDPALVERARILREKGTNRQAFLAGQIEHYSWVDLGSSGLLAEVLAAALVTQLDAADAIWERRRWIWNTYQTRLAAWAHRTGTRLPTPLHRAQPAAHLYHVVMKDPAARAGFLDHLSAAGIGATFHYVPLHSSPQGRRVGRSGPLPVTDAVAARLARLPLYPDLTDQEVDRIVDAVTTFRP